MVSQSRRDGRAGSAVLVVDDDHLGTPESRWRGCVRLRSLPSIGPLNAQRIVIVAPHPDDEVFGAGGLLQRAQSQGVAVSILAVTDGEGSHPSLASRQAAHLARRRVGESLEALRRLGVSDPGMKRLRLPDGRVSHHREELREVLAASLRATDLCVAPWRRDGHPDHDACGEIARLACDASGARLWSYFVWAWHWTDPDGEEFPWSQGRQLVLTRREVARKRWATMAFATQTSEADAQRGGPVLPAPILRRFWREAETFAEEGFLDRDVN